MYTWVRVLNTVLAHIDTKLIKKMKTNSANKTKELIRKGRKKKKVKKNEKHDQHKSHTKRNIFSRSCTRLMSRDGSEGKRKYRRRNFTPEVRSLTRKHLFIMRRWIVFISANHATDNF